jgi:hypothetical protein
MRLGTRVQFPPPPFHSLWLPRATNRSSERPTAIEGLAHGTLRTNGENPGDDLGNNNPLLAHAEQRTGFALPSLS